MGRDAVGKRITWKPTTTELPSLTAMLPAVAPLETYGDASPKLSDVAAKMDTTFELAVLAPEVSPEPPFTRHVLISETAAHCTLVCDKAMPEAVIATDTVPDEVASAEAITVMLLLAFSPVAVATPPEKASQEMTWMPETLGVATPVEIALAENFIPETPIGSEEPVAKPFAEITKALLPDTSADPTEAETPPTKYAALPVTIAMPFALATGSESASNTAGSKTVEANTVIYLHPFKLLCDL